MQNTTNKKPLGLFALIMIAVVSVDSLRNLPISAQYGFSLVTFYLLAGLTFFLPLTWVAGKLSANYPSTGGSYVWIEKAFGPAFGHLSIWLQWVYNIIWYPTIFAFINATLAALIAPDLETDKWFILITSLGFFWLLTIIHCFGLKAISWISTFGAIVGTLIPMLLMSLFAGYWLLLGNPSATPFTWHALLPDEHSLKNLAFFSNILFSILGLEIICMHAGNVVNPEKTYPRALTLSAIIILFTIMTASVALCVMLPANEIGLINGLTKVFDTFFQTYQIPFSAKIVDVCIIIGGLAIASSWMVGLARGLHVALTSIDAPAWLLKCNRKEMPARVLLTQAIVYSIILSAFLLFPNINNSYWILSALTSQFALLYYVLLFIAANKLLRQLPLTGFSKILTVLFPLMACSICVCGIIAGFLPPEQIPSDGIVKYETVMIGSFCLMIFLPILLIRNKQKK